MLSDKVAIFMIILTVVATASFLIGLHVERSIKQSSAVEIGCAQYDSKTGDWGWIKKEEGR